MYISCSEYYEKYLGDNCDKECDKCFGDKEICYCIKSFTTIGENLKQIKVEKGEIFIIDERTNIHTILRKRNDSGRFYARNEFYRKHFDETLNCLKYL